MNKFRKIVLPIVFLIISLGIVLFGLSYTGVIHLEKINIDTDVFLPSENIQTNDEVIQSLNLINLTKQKQNVVFNTEMNAVWLDFNKDFDFSSEDSLDEIKYSLYSDLNYYRNFLTDAYFISPDVSGDFSSLKEQDGQSFDVVSYFLYFARQLKCKAILVVDDKILSSGNDEDIIENIKNYINKYNFDAVLMSSEKIFFTEAYTEKAVLISDFLDKYYPYVPFGVEVRFADNEISIDDHTVDVFEKKIPDFALADCGGAVGSTGVSFEAGAALWDSFSQYYNIPLYCRHRADLVFSDQDVWGFGYEINNQLRKLYNYPGFKGSCYYSGSSLKSKKMLARDLSIFLNDVAEKEHVSFSVTGMTVSPEYNTVKFSGYTQPENKVFCSDMPINTFEGKFEQNYMLAPGINVFDFTSSGEHYKYDIDNNLPVIVAYSHQNGFRADEKTNVEIAALCEKNSSVYAVVNGKNFAMIPSDKTIENIQVPYGYLLYTCTLNADITGLFKNKELDIVCANTDVQAVVSCGQVSFVKDGENKNILDPVDYLRQYKHYSSAKIAPFLDYGLGKAVMCRIKNNKTKQVGEVDSYDTFRPYHSSLLRDTFDYVDKISLGESGNLVYELKSGINVSAESAQLITNAYVLPPSNVVLKSFDDNDPKMTKFVFTSDWRQPVTVELQPLDYKKGFMDFSYNINSFNAEYIDVNFFYCGKFSESEKISFASNSVFAKYEILNNENGILKLRLYFRNPGSFYGFNLNENADGDIELTFKKHDKASVAGKTIMIDAGHGGYSMTGTALNDDSYSEAQVTLILSNKIKRYLEGMGAKVILTRNADTSITLSERLDMCENMDPDIFISIHCDGSDNLEESGTHTFYFKPYSKPLADSIHASLVSTYRSSIYKEEDENYKNIDKKVKYYPFYVTRVDNCPSVLIETGFMTNFLEGRILINPVYQDYLAKGIADGINNYFYSNVK